MAQAQPSRGRDRNQRPAGRPSGQAGGDGRRQGRDPMGEQQRSGRQSGQRRAQATPSAFAEGLLLPLERPGRSAPAPLRPSPETIPGQPKPRQRRPPGPTGPRQAKGPKRALLLSFLLGIGVGYGLVGPFGSLVGAGLAKLWHPGSVLASMAPPVATGNHRVLVIGTDQVSGNTDSLFTLHLDGGKTELTQVPRDTYIESDQYGPMKANALYANGGVPLVQQELSKLLSAPVDHYIVVNLNAVQHLGDALGGVDVDVPKRMLYTDQTQGLTIDLYPGRQLLKGKDLEGFLRFRHDGLGDLGRMQRQQLVLNEVFRKLANPAFVTQLPALLKIAGTDIKTDLSPLQIGGLLSAMGTTKLNIQQLSGKSYWHADIDYWMPDINPHHAEYQSQYPEG